MILTNINKHILELKNRIFLLTITWVSTVFSCYSFKEILLHSIITTFQNLNPYFIITDVAELFNIYLQIIFFIGNQILFIFFLYHSVMFLSSGLYKKELQTVKSTTFLISIIFTLSFLITKFLTIPFMNSFFFQYQYTINNMTSIPIFFEAKLKEYISFYINIYFLTLINLSVLTSIIYLLNNLYLNNNNNIKKIRKLVYFIFLLFSTLVTPPDVISQLLLTLLLIVIYELALLYTNISKATS